MCDWDPYSYAMLECRQSLIRRTVWDGDHELWEIQMPGQDGSSYMENDTSTVNLPRSPEGLDPHPFYGRVTYTHGLEIDRPLAVTRIGYVDFKPGMSSRHTFAPFTVIPGWSLRGDPDRQYIAEPTITTCTSGSGSTPCVWVEAPMRWWAYGAPARLMDHDHWYGTLIEQRADKAGTFYRRNRYYDHATGRFTQEDPIGLAGGLNLYGYANGDPISHSDPFGLWCEKRGSGNGERLYCKDIGPGDFYTIRDYLGGAAGESAFNTFAQAGLTKWSPSTCRGGFSDSQCTMLAQSFSKLTLHTDSRCSSLGVSATKRFRAGRFRYKDLPGNLLGYAQKFLPWGTITLDPDASYSRKLWMA